MHRDPDFFEKGAQVRAIHRESLKEHAPLRVQQNVVSLRGQQIMRLRVEIAECNHGFARVFKLRNRPTDLEGLTCRRTGEIL